MPIPIIAWAAGAAAVTVAGAAYNYLKFEYGPTLLTGPQQSGKTHLANWLVYQKLLDNYVATTNKMEIGEFTDIRGGEIQVKDWEPSIKGKKNIFYLFDMEKFIIKSEYVNTTYDDIVLKHIAMFTENFKPKRILEDKNLIIIGTFLDKIKESQAQEIIDIIHHELCANLNIIYGSLVDNSSASKLEKEIKKMIKG